MNYSLSDSSIYCLGGNCHSPTIEENQDFGNVAYLAAINEAQKDCDKESSGICKKPITVFAGETNGCDKAVVGFINCCSANKGWGKDIKLSSCSPEEKGLALKRGKGLCHMIGTYCETRESITKICLVKRTNFCCFNSKLARIFHEQGRSQLNIDWGSSEFPNCRPLTLEELTKLDYSKFDMEELFGAMLAKGKSNMFKTFPSINLKKLPKLQQEHMNTTPAEKRDILKRKAEEEERARRAKEEEKRLAEEARLKAQQEKEKEEQERRTAIAQKVEELNGLYLESFAKYKESIAKRDYFYKQGVINGVNAFLWVKSNPTRCFYSFFRDTLKVSDTSPENVDLIQNRLYKNLPLYLAEEKKVKFYRDEYQRYYKDMLKLKEK
jgi:conjugal transfer mating pair stabilization protein TraN